MVIPTQRCLGGLQCTFEFGLKLDSDNSDNEERAGGYIKGNSEPERMIVTDKCTVYSSTHPVQDKSRFFVGLDNCKLTHPPLLLGIRLNEGRSHNQIIPELTAYHTNNYA